MMRLIASDGATFEGATAAEIVRRMADAQWNAPERKGAYKQEVVDRVHSMTGVSISRSAMRDPARFLRYLVRAGVCTLDTHAVPLS